MIDAVLRVTGASGATIQPRLFGGFLEHLGRAVYGGIYEPGHSSAGPDGMRQDVIELVRELGMTVVRYPGGNFVSAYNWEDGVGPRAERPVRLDLAWHSLETNQVGLDEFDRWAQAAGVEPMLAVNLGTRGLADAIRLLEYCQAPIGTLADWRRQHGRAEPYGVKLWCLGNEMDGPWQLGHRSAEDYASLADQTAHAMLALDDSLELVACGPSGPNAPGFEHWAKTVLRTCYNNIAYLSCHWYVEPLDRDLGSYLSSAVELDRYIAEIIRLADVVGVELGSSKPIDISFDEWNVWRYEANKERDTIAGVGNWPFAPPLLEEQYTVADGVMVGSILISLLNQAERVKIACLAQVVNAIAPIMTVPGGPAWRQTTFYPFALTAPVAGGQLRPVELEAPTQPTLSYGSVPVVQAAAIDGGDRAEAVGTIFVVNRSADQPVCLRLSVPWATASVELTVLSDSDPTAANSAETPNRVVPQVSEMTPGDSVVLPPASWGRIRFR
jgi:alpha-N-arabinofuranosidase